MNLSVFVWATLLSCPVFNRINVSFYVCSHRGDMRQKQQKSTNQKTTTTKQKTTQQNKPSKIKNKTSHILAYYINPSNLPTGLAYYINPSNLPTGLLTINLTIEFMTINNQFNNRIYKYYISTHDQSTRLFSI